MLTHLNTNSCTIKRGLNMKHVSLQNKIGPCTEGRVDNARYTVLEGTTNEEKNINVHRVNHYCHTRKDTSMFLNAFPYTVAI